MSSNFRKSEQQWKIDALNAYSRDYSFKSASGDDVNSLYYPDDINAQYIDDLNFPGLYQ